PAPGEKLTVVDLLVVTGGDWATPFCSRGYGALLVDASGRRFETVARENAVRGMSDDYFKGSRVCDPLPPSSVKYQKLVFQLPAQRPGWPRGGWRLAVFFLALLVLNYYIGSRATQGPSRVRVPYSPFFLQQVRAGNVVGITSKGTAIQGVFKQPERYGKAKPTTKFKTEIPAFANTDQLSRLLQSKGVVVNAQPLDTGAPWWETLLVNFLPTILFIGLLVLLMRRAGNAQ